MKTFSSSSSSSLENKHLLLVIAVVVVLTLQLYGCESCFTKEREGLLEIKAFFITLFNAENRSGEINILPSWTDDDPNSDCCSWERVGCSKITGHVVGLSLHQMMLPYNRDQRSFPLSNRFLNLSLLHNFQELQSLYFYQNSFRGFFDDVYGVKSLGRLKKLRFLGLSENQFNTSILPFLSEATSLEELRLQTNLMEGVLPTQVFANLTALKVLDLSDNLLSGKPQMQGLCGLTYLQELDLSHNAFIGLPSCLSNLTHLRTFDLSHNQLSGNIPSFLFDLSSLEYLSLLSNNFEGSFLLNSLTNQSRLKILRLSPKSGKIQVQTQGSWIPPFQLKMLQLQNCILGGGFLDFLQHQQELVNIDLSQSKPVGALPSWLLQNNTKLKSMVLRNNSLTEFHLPTVVHGLHSLDISNNELTGSLPERIGNIFPNITSMNVSNNGFQGVIPSSMGEMKILSGLDMSSNRLSGQLPGNFLTGCVSLALLKLSNNKFQGQIFPNYSNLVGLQALFLDNNSFTGVEMGLLMSPLLAFLDISNNRLTGRIPTWIDKLSKLSVIWMSGNQIEGPFPHQLQNLAGLKSLDISSNKLSGPLPKNMNFSSLEELSLQNNGLAGSIPDALLEFPKLLVLDLRNNNLTGKISDSIGKLSEINVLLLQKNHLQGQIPYEICHLRKVNFLDLSHNGFNGFIPSCLSNMSFGTLKEMQSTRETYRGGIGFTFQDILTTITYIYESDLILDKRGENSYTFQPVDKVEFSTKGRYESFQGGFVWYRFGLDLSSNGLSGDIPTQVGDLLNIQSLNLSHNHLTSSIPESISKLKSIESLDLSYNKLNGNIPSQLADLNFLGTFRVAYNNLSGQIPFTGQLRAFDERSYVGNDELCGLPTNKSCGFTDVPPNSPNADDDGNVIDMTSFYWSFGASYVTVLLGLFVFLCMDSPWSREWFYRVDLCIYHLKHLKLISIFK